MYLLIRNISTVLTNRSVEYRIFEHANKCSTSSAIKQGNAVYSFIVIDSTINISIKQLSVSNINDSQIAIVNNLSTLLSVRSGAIIQKFLL